jgi:hypothetical protein
VAQGARAQFPHAVSRQIDGRGSEGGIPPVAVNTSRRGRKDRS